MPHVNIKIYSGKTEVQKQQLADAIVQDFIRLFGYGEDAVSVAIEDVNPADWKTKVYEQEIRKNPSRLYKKPGYNM